MDLAAALTGVRVLEIASPWTGFAGRLLAGLGADVVLVRPGDDGSREWFQTPEFLHLNWMKRHVEVDLTTNDGARAAQSWAQCADVVIEGLTEAERECLSLDPEASVERGAIHACITPWGTASSPHDRPATDLTVTAAGGMMAQVGHPDGPPVPVPKNQSVRLAGVHAAIGVLMAMRTVPQIVDVAAIRAVASALEGGALSYLYEDSVAGRSGHAHPFVPHQLFAASDGWVAGGLGGSPRMWDGLIAWMEEQDGAADLADEHRRDPRLLRENRDHIMTIVQDFVRSFSRDDFSEEAQARRLPWAPVLSTEDLTRDQHLHERSAIIDLPAGAGGGQDVDVAVGHVRPSSNDEWQKHRRPAGSAESLPLEGVRVLDLTWVLAGPSTTRILADFGATVVKVESHNRPDPTRFAPQFRLNRDPAAGPEESGYFNNVNRGKQSIQLDLRSEPGRRIARQLALHSDVIVENYSAGVLERLGLAYDDLRDENPALVVMRLSGLGQTGPRRHWVSYADAVSALSGLTSQTRDANGQPVGVVFGYADLVGGYHAALAVVAALADEHRGGEIDLSQLEAMLSQLGPLEPDDGASGCGRFWAVVQGIAGRWLAVDADDPDVRDRLCAFLGRAADVSDEELRMAVASRAALLPVGLLGARLRGLGIPAEPVADARDLVEHEPALREFYRIVRHPMMGECVVEGQPAHLSRTPARIEQGAPILGADTCDVLRDAGITDAELEQLRAQGVLR